MYKFITCPKTGNIYTVSSKNGEKIIMNYVEFMSKQSGGSPPRISEDYSEKREKLDILRQTLIDKLFGDNNYNKKYSLMLISIINKIDTEPDNIKAIIELVEKSIDTVSAEDNLRRVTASRYLYLSQMTELYEDLENTSSEVDEITTSVMSGEEVVDKYMVKEDIHKISNKPDLIGENILKRPYEPDFIDDILNLRSDPTINRNLLEERLDLLKKITPSAEPYWLKMVLNRELDLSISEGDITQPSRILKCFLDEECRDAIIHKEPEPGAFIDLDTTPSLVQAGGAATAPLDLDSSEGEALKWGLNIQRLISRRLEPAHDFSAMRNLTKTMSDVVKSKVKGQVLGGFKTKAKLIPRKPLKTVLLNPLRLLTKIGGRSGNTIKFHINEFLKNTFIGAGVEQSGSSNVWTLTGSSDSVQGEGWCNLDCGSEMTAFGDIFCPNNTFGFNKDQFDLQEDKFINKSNYRFTSSNYLLDMLKPLGNQHEGPTFNLLHNNPYITETGALYDDTDPYQVRKFYSQFHYFIDYGVDAQQSFIIFTNDILHELYCINPIIKKRSDTPKATTAARKKALPLNISEKLQQILTHNNIVNYTMDCTLAGSLSRGPLSAGAARKIWGKGAAAADSLYALTSDLRKSNFLNYMIPITNKWDPAPGGSNPEYSQTIGGIKLIGDNTILFDSFRESSRRIFFLDVDTNSQTNDTEIHIWYNKMRTDWYNISAKYFNDKVRDRYRVFDSSYKEWPSLNLESIEGKQYMYNPVNSLYIGKIDSCPGVDLLILLRYITKLYLDEVHLYLDKLFITNSGMKFIKLYNWVENFDTLCFSETPDNYSQILKNMKNIQYNNKAQATKEWGKAALKKINKNPIKTKGAVINDKYIKEHISKNCNLIPLTLDGSPQKALSLPLTAIKEAEMIRLQGWSTVYAFLMATSGGTTVFDKCYPNSDCNNIHFKNRKNFHTNKGKEHCSCNQPNLNSTIEGSCQGCLKNRLEGPAFVFLKLISEYINDGIEHIPVSTFTRDAAGVTEYKNHITALQKSADLFYLDIKKSGDYSQVKLDRLLNILNNDRQTIHIVNDRLAGLAAITNETHVMVAGKIIEFNSESDVEFAQSIEDNIKKDSVLNSWKKLRTRQKKTVIFGDSKYQSRGELNRYTSLVVYTNNNTIDSGGDITKNFLKINTIKDLVRTTNNAMPKTSQGTFSDWIQGNDMQLSSGAAAAAAAPAPVTVSSNTENLTTEEIKNKETVTKIIIEHTQLPESVLRGIGVYVPVETSEHVQDLPDVISMNKKSHINVSATRKIAALDNLVNYIKTLIEGDGIDSGVKGYKKYLAETLYDSEWVNNFFKTPGVDNTWWRKPIRRTRTKYSELNRLRKKYIHDNPLPEIKINIAVKKRKQRGIKKLLKNKYNEFRLIIGSAVRRHKVRSIGSEQYDMIGGSATVPDIPDTPIKNEWKWQTPKRSDTDEISANISNYISWWHRVMRSTYRWQPDQAWVTQERSILADWVKIVVESIELEINEFLNMLDENLFYTISKINTDMEHIKTTTDAQPVTFKLSEIMIVANPLAQSKYNISTNNLISSFVTIVRDKIGALMPGAIDINKLDTVHAQSIGRVLTSAKNLIFKLADATQMPREIGFNSIDYGINSTGDDSKLYFNASSDISSEPLEYDEWWHKKNTLIDINHTQYNSAIMIFQFIQSITAGDEVDIPPNIKTFLNNDATHVKKTVSNSYKIRKGDGDYGDEEYTCEIEDPANWVEINDDVSLRTGLGIYYKDYVYTEGEIRILFDDTNKSIIKYNLFIERFFTFIKILDETDILISADTYSGFIAPLKTFYGGVYMELSASIKILSDIYYKMFDNSKNIARLDTAITNLIILFGRFGIMHNIDKINIRPDEHQIVYIFNTINSNAYELPLTANQLFAYLITIKFPPMIHTTAEESEAAASDGGAAAEKATAASDEGAADAFDPTTQILKLKNYYNNFNVFIVECYEELYNLTWHSDGIISKIYKNIITQYFDLESMDDFNVSKENLETLFGGLPYELDYIHTIDTNLIATQELPETKYPHLKSVLDKCVEEENKRETIINGLVLNNFKTLIEKGDELNVHNVTLFDIISYYYSIGFVDNFYFKIDADEAAKAGGGAAAKAGGGAAAKADGGAVASKTKGGEAAGGGAAAKTEFKELVEQLNTKFPQKIAQIVSSKDPTELSTRFITQIKYEIDNIVDDATEEEEEEE